jgi:membrane protein
MDRPPSRSFLVRLYEEVDQDNLGLLAAALAFYTGLSVAPLLVLFLWIGGLLGSDVQQALVDEVQRLIGPEGGRAIELIIRNAEQRPDAGTLASFFSAAVLLFAAARVFNQLQLTMNLIWRVHVEPRRLLSRRMLWEWVRKRLLSLAMVVSLGFLLLVSLVLSAALTYLSGAVRGSFPRIELVWPLLETAASLVVSFLLFAGVFKFLPDVKVPWKDVWVGALITSLFFAIGKILIGQYLGRTSISSSYGAAGALIVFLLWVYYSALTMLLGAE